MKLPSRLGGIVAVGSLFAVAACGGGSTPSTPAASGSASSAPTGSGTVNVAAVWTGNEQANFEKVLAAFTQQTGIKTTFKSTGDNIATYLNSQLAGKNPPDVAILPQPGLLNSLAKQGALKPLDATVTGNLQQHYAPYWVNLASSGGQHYGVYFKVANKSTWWYLPKAFQAAGVSAPGTWTQMLTDAKTVAASGTPYVAIGGADGWTLTDWFENIYLRQAGPAMYDKLTTHSIPWTDPSVTKALETFRQLLTTPGAVLGGITGASQTDFNTSVNDVLTAKPKAATVFEGDFVPGSATDQSLKLGTDVNFFNFPSINGSGPTVVGGGDVAVGMTSNPNTQKLLAYLATPQAAEVWAKAGGFTSPNKDVPTSAYPNSVQASLAKAVVSAAAAGNLRFDMSDQAPPAFGGTKGSGEWQDLQNFLRNPSNIAAVQQQLEKDAKTAYGH